MITAQDLITEKHSKATFFSNFEEKYILMDNLDEKGEPIIHARPERYNANYFFDIMVLRGTLNLLIGETPVAVHGNEMLAIRPGLHLTVLESRCIFFTLLTSSQIMNDILEHSDMGKENMVRAFTFKHLHYNAEQTNLMLQGYNRLRKEHKRAFYPMKEMVLRAYTTAALAKGMSFTTEADAIHTMQSKQGVLFLQFIDILSREYKKERSVSYYAQRMSISSKYLSTITQSQTGFSASQVIDLYVTQAIKQCLYSHEYNIKVLSEQFNFPSQSFFGRFFKRVAGMSPNEYIKENNRVSLNFKNENDAQSSVCQK